MRQTRVALVLGATGGIGGELARALLARGWRVRALHRNAVRQAANQPASQPDDRIEWLQGDAMVAADVATAAMGAELLVHAVNPPGYRRWAALVLPMLDNSIAAASTSGARIVLPGTVYNYGPDAFPEPAETSPQHPVTRKGAIRAEMEQRLRAAGAEGVRSLVVRAGDFFGPRAANNWFSQGLVKPGQPLRSVSYPGRRGVGHQWAYLPDLAEATLRLHEREARSEPFETFHFAGHWDPDGTAMVAAIRRVAGDPTLPERRFPWALLTMAAPFVTTLREMMEMRYLWRMALRMDNARLVRAIGAEPHTPLDEAVRATLAGLGCLPLT